MSIHGLLFAYARVRKLDGHFSMIGVLVHVLKIAAKKIGLNRNVVMGR